MGGAAAHRAELDAEIDANSRAPLHALNAIRAALPRDGVVFSDMTQIAYLGNYAFPTDGPGEWFHPSGYGTLGFALPAAHRREDCQSRPRRTRAGRRLRAAIHAA
jgi:5-guanidino-2-oxopentanoate decarboxylase